MKVKKLHKALSLFAIMLFCTMASVSEVQAKEEDTTYKNGIYIGKIDASGKTKAEIETELDEYLEDLNEKVLEFKVLENKVEVPVEELKLSISNKEVLDEALEHGVTGNIIKRYKALKDLERNPVYYDIALTPDEEALKTVIEEKCVPFNEEAVDAKVKKNGDKFEIEEGKSGLVVDVEESVKVISEFFQKEWNHENAEVAVSVKVEEPKGKTEDLAKIKDVLGSFSTSYSSSGKSRSANVTNGADLINGVVLYPGETFSSYETVSPFTEANGYYMAGSYLNGMVVDSLGGGICQVTSTLYNAVLRAELEIVERFNHSMSVSYVDLSADAAIAGTTKDFKFKNNYDNPIFIEGYTTSDKRVHFNIYGVETRDTVNRKVQYVSKTTSTTPPGPDQIVADGGRPLGYVATAQSAHTGYTAELYKVVTENGVEVSNERINKSTYKMTPRYVTIGTATADPIAAAAINNAIASGNADTARAVAAAYSVPDPVAQAQAAQAAHEAAIQAQLAAQQAAAEGQVAP